MNISTKTASVTEFPCDALIVNLFEGVTAPGGATGAVDKVLDGLISEIIGREGFKGKAGEVLSIHTHGKLPARRVIVAGLGQADKLNLDAIRKASSAACRAARDAKADLVASILHGAGAGGISPERSAQATVEGAVIGTYRFLEYKSEPDSHEIAEFTLIESDPAKASAAAAGAQRGRIVADAVNCARDLINAPANKVTPTYLAEFAAGLAGQHGMELVVLDRDEFVQLGMGSYAAVGFGSEQPPKFIALTYRTDAPSPKTVAIIGKGVTFDSGGLSLKTADGMTTMKDDMSGAAAVLSVMKAIAVIKPRVNVLAIVAATENMPSGSAVKPGDVVRAMNGKTIEVENTDAEGRLTLADALCYAVDRGADEIIDLATLTGACVVALGRGLSGLFCNDPTLQENLMMCSRVSGDHLWPMPLFDDYFEQIKSEVADMKNTGGREAGATTAALLLKEFVDGKPWAHIDIAGPAFIDKDNGLYGKGGTGAGVRLLLEHLCGGSASA